MTVVMGVLIVSFGVWGIADIFRGFGQSTLAKVGSTEISTNEFRQIYTDRLQQIGRQFGRPLTQDQARTFGLDRQVLEQTIAEAALDEQARRLGLGQSDAETLRVIMNDPNFKGLGGKFDQQRFQGTIRQFGFTEARYIADQRRAELALDRLADLAGWHRESRLGGGGVEDGGFRHHAKVDVGRIEATLLGKIVVR